MPSAKKASLWALGALAELAEYGYIISFFFFIGSVYPFVFTKVLNCFIWFFLCYGINRYCVRVLRKFGLEPSWNGVKKVEG